MALITCADCGREISDAAASCPHCGRPMRPQAVAQDPDRIVRARPESTLLEKMGCVYPLVIVAAILLAVIFFPTSCHLD